MKSVLDKLYIITESIVVGMNSVNDFRVNE